VRKHRHRSRLSDHGLQRDVFAALTVAAALLLNRQGKLLLHAAAFVAPDGLAWLLIGDSHSGKSTTCASLMRYGLAFLADDQVVVSAAERACFRGRLAAAFQSR
jgi:hypothetical protein